MPDQPDVASPAVFVLVPGAGGSAWYWHRVVDVLTARGSSAVAVDLPAADDTAGLADYADVLAAAAQGRGPVVLVAQSMGALTAPLVCDRVPVEQLVLVNAMVPRPSETGGDWWANTEQGAAMAALAAEDGRDLDDDPDLLETFFHDVPADVREAAMASGPQPQSATPFGDPWPLEQWPDVPTVALVGRDDRFFPADFQRRVLRERLGVEPDEMPGGHLVALSQPEELADRLLAAYAGRAAAPRPGARPVAQA